MLKLYTLFNPGTDHMASCRIPELLLTGRGTLLAFCEYRYRPDDSDPMAIAVRRREAGGAWGDLRVVQEELDGWVGNPAAFCAGGEAHLVFSKNNSQLFVATSHDDGATFDEPRDITYVLEKYRGTWDPVMFGAGPGGVCASASGRVFVPVWIANGRHVYTDGGIYPTSPQRAAVIYSDDCGKTWGAGDLIYDKGNPGVSYDEAQMIETPDGYLLSIRHKDGRRRRAFARSKDGVRWGEPQVNEAIKECDCQAALKRFGDLVLASQPDCETKRVRMSIQYSRDYGATFSKPVLLNEGASAYSALERLPDGTFVCMFETYVATDRFSGGYSETVAEFDMEFLLG